MSTLKFVLLVCVGMMCLAGCTKYHLVAVPYEVCEDKAKEKCATGFSVFYYNDMGTVYSWGSNEFGQLGAGDVKDKSSAQKVKLPSTFE